METLIPLITITIIVIFVLVSIKQIATPTNNNVYNGKKRKKTTETESNEQKKEPTKITPPAIVKTDIIIWGSWDKDKAVALTSSITKFNMTNRRINVIYVYKQNLDLALSSIIGAVNTPDIILFDRSNTALYMRKKHFIPLDTLIEAEQVSLQDFLPAAIDELTFNNTTYGLPLTINTKGLLYNKDIFNEFSLTEPPSDWNQLTQYAKKFTIRNKNEFLRSGIAINDEGIFPAVLASYGGSMFTPDGTPNFNSQAGIDVLTKWHQLIYKDNVYELGFSDNNTHSFFSEGKVAMRFGDLNTVRTLNKMYPNLNYGIAPIPAGSVAPVKPIITGYGLGIYQNSTNNEFAFDVIKYLTCNQGSIEKMFTTTGLVSANLKSYSSPIFNTPIYSEIIKYMATGVHREHNINYNRIDKEALVLNIQLILSDIVTAKDGLQDAENRAVAIINGEDI